MSADNVDTVREALDAWNRADLDALLESCHPEIEWYSEIVGRIEGAAAVYRGRAEIRRFWDESHSAWNATIEVAELRDLGDTVVALGRIRTRGEASGVDLDEPAAYVYELEGGLIRKGREYLDQSEALGALGLRE